jgi:predicted nucleotidyltransferase
VTLEQAHAAIARFAGACDHHPLVAAAFLGGSYAAGTANESSDLDLYVVTEEVDYPGFFAARLAFMLSWANAATLQDMLNFEGLGFDMLGFECPDGVWGQVALGHTGNMMALHGGPHDVLVDKRGLLADVTFPLL